MLGQIPEYMGFMSTGEGLLIVPFSSENAFDAYLKKSTEVRWAHLVVRDTGHFIKSTFIHSR